MCDRSSDPTEHDAARERPSALETLRPWLRHSSSCAHFGLGPICTCGLYTAIARLTDPDAGEGTEHRPEWLNDVPTGYCECGADWTDAGCARSRAMQQPAVQPEPTWQDLVMLCPKCADPTHLCDEHAAMKAAVQPEGGPE